jgi:NAD(P)-dependent dehydrogenase (short-subunit alcohol dehydrogenase family)
MQVEERKVMVVGAGSGMGFALCEQLVQRRCEVLMVGRSRDKLEAARARLQAPAQVRVIVADVTDEAQVASLFESSGAIDHLACTAADIRGAYELLPQLALDAVDRALRSKVVAPILLAKHGARSMAPGGSMSFVSGIAAYRPRAKGVVVAAINAALEGMVRALAVELAPLRVNAVSPGWVRTGIWKDVAGDAADDVLAAMAERLPVGRTGTPGDIAEAMLFLMGSGYTTGTVLHVEGGHRLA